MSNPTGSHFRVFFMKRANAVPFNDFQRGRTNEGNVPCIMMAMKEERTFVSEGQMEEQPPEKVRQLWSQVGKRIDETQEGKKRLIEA